MMVACDSPGEFRRIGAAPDEQAAEVLQAVTNGCSTVTSVPQFSPAVATRAPGPRVAANGIRPIAPIFLRQGGWSSGQFIMDGNSFTLPAISATSQTPGLITVPFQQGDQPSAVSLYVCGNTNTALLIDTFATETPDNPSDSPQGTGSGMLLHPGPAWSEFRVNFPPISLTSDSQFYIQLSAVATTTPASPINLAVAGMWLSY